MTSNTTLVYPGFVYRADGCPVRLRSAVGGSAVAWLHFAMSAQALNGETISPFWVALASTIANQVHAIAVCS
jgi:hypothetical protein